jgi:glyoxylase-like metal-dependent hydrolase (beta-lactamase superfamily II)
MRFPITAALLVAFLLSVSSASAVSAEATPQTYRPELEYLKVVNSAGPATDPQLIFLLMGQYLNANRLQEGIEFFASFLARYEAKLSPVEKSLYLTALGLLRAAHADDVFLLKRIAWVNETIAILEEARRLSNNEVFIVRWGTGLAYAQLPARFDKAQTALDDLEWCLRNSDKAPLPGFMREVNYWLAKLHKSVLRDDVKANEFLKRSGYASLERDYSLTTSLAVNSSTGASFFSRRITEVVPGKVFALSGFDFTEFYFVVSSDRQQLIGIDAGTHPDAAQAAHEALTARFPGLPKLTTVFFTHAHWDHIGGHSYFRRLNPGVRFYARDNFREELDRILNATLPDTYFFGTRFKPELMATFKPDTLISQPTEVSIGGTLFRLIPILGGETPDGMLIDAPAYQTLFVGDFIMPYFGAPQVEEGDIGGLFRAIDTVLTIQPRTLLHGHEPLTRLFNEPALPEVKRQLEWLNRETRELIKVGTTRPDIHRRNLIPPFIQETPHAHLAYLVMRENFINRVYDQNVGYWQPGLVGLDHVSERDMGAAYLHYFKLTDKQIATSVEAMIGNGDLELAGKVVNQALAREPASEALKLAKRKVFLRLREKYQEFNPFKFFTYSQEIDAQTKQLD